MSWEDEEPTDLSGVESAIGVVDGLLDVPAKDVTTDAYMREVVGKKDDTAQTTVATTRSLMAYLKGALNSISTVSGYHTVPTKDAATDAQMRDVVGKKDDTAVTTVGTTKTLMAYLKGALNSIATLTGYVYAREQVKVISVTAQANAGADTTLGTVGTAGVIITGIVIHADDAQPAHLTSCPVMGGAGKVLTFIQAADALQADLDAESKQVSWTGEIYLPVAGTIVMVHNGSGTDLLNLTVTITYKATVAGGTLT